ncbi:MAG: hypothetical protein ACE5FL_00655 [Myxococcota bacterium]
MKAEFLRDPWAPWAAAIGIVAAALLAGCGTVGGPAQGTLLYPAPPQRPRVQYLETFTGADDVEGEASPLMKFLVGDINSRRRFRKPTGLAVHDGVIYVADPGWDTVLRVDLKERVFEPLGDRGDGKLRVPVALAIDDEGSLYVVDSGRRQIVQFNPQREFVRAFESPEEFQPSGVAVAGDILYVSNRARHEVLLFDRFSGERVRTLGEYGSRDGEFNIPTALAVDPDGHLFVTDMANFRIQEFDAEGDFVRSYGFLGDGPGTFARPKGIGTDRDGHLYTVDAAFENVQIWDTSNAQVLLSFGGPGVSPGDMYLPSALTVSYELVPYFETSVDPAFDLEYVIVVANNYGPHKIAVYGFINPKDPDRYPDSPISDEGEEN